MKKRIGIIILLLFIVSVCGYFLFIRPENERLKAVRTMDIEKVDMNQIENGIYRGEYSYGSFTYVVEVEVMNHAIVNIQALSNRDTEHAVKAEKVLQHVMSEQTVNVDVISGATTTSKALLKAAENALKSGSSAPVH